MCDRLHITALLRKNFSKKVVGSPWIHPASFCGLESSTLKDKNVRLEQLMETIFVTDEVSMYYRWMAKGLFVQILQNILDPRHYLS